MSWLALLVAALIQVRGESMAGGTVGGSVTVPLERARNGDTPVLRFTSPAGTVSLLLDTGASSTLVTPALAQRLGLITEAVDTEGFELAGGGSECGSLRPLRTRLPLLELSDGKGSLWLGGTDALVLPVAALPPGIDGVLGAPTLRQMPIGVDPVDQTVRLGAAALALRSTPPTLRVPLRWRMGVPLVRMTSAAGPVEALADSGAEGLFLSPSLARRLSPLSPPRPLRLVGFCGEQTASLQTFSPVVMPGERPGEAAEPVQGIVTDNPIFAQLGVEAIVGQEHLRRRRQLWRLDLDPPRLDLW